VAEKGLTDHYDKLAITPFEYGLKNGLDPLQFTIVKYVTRFRDKNGIRDLLAAQETLNQLIEHERQVQKTAETKPKFDGEGTLGSALPTTYSARQTLNWTAGEG
jgi:hypothetical protein